MENLTVLDKAIIFAVKAHEGAKRKGSELPYIVHPLEAVSIVATITSDLELLAAAALHDVIEDTSYTKEDIKKEFGERVAGLVEAESDIKIYGKDSKDGWVKTKTFALERLKNANIEAKIVALGDKLSNMRAIEQDYKKVGEELWQRFNVKEKSLHGWRYRLLKSALKDLDGTSAYKEFCETVDRVFPEE